MTAVLLLLTGCGKTDDESLTQGTGSRSSEFDIEIPGAGSASGGDVLNEYFIEGRSIILISQRGNNLSIDFNDYIISQDDPSVTLPNPNLYKYVYYSNPEADWDAGYNFMPYGNYELNWDAMLANPLNGEYSLGALYYPVEYEVMESVETDQSKRENVLRSNILGAWHRTNIPRDRLRFRFYHLMAALRVTLLIPAWEPEGNSGFGENAAASGTTLNVKKDFIIDWPIQDSEYSPVPQLKPDAVSTDITMYLESVSNETETIEQHSITPNFPQETDTYRRATFTVLIPPQQLINEGTPAMRFVLSTIGGTERTYVWYASDLIDSSLTLGRGSVTNLMLAIPRSENNAILIKAYVEDWIPADSEFAVIPEN